MKILLTGLGQLSAGVLDNVLRMPGDHEILVVARDPAKVEPRLNLSLLSASALGHDHPVGCEQLDLMNSDQTASTLARFKPDMIFHAATLQAIWTLRALPAPLFQRLHAAQIGPWLPMHLTLARRLMLALRESAETSVVINAAVPDVVNVVLARAGLAPLIGIGNIALVEPAIHRATALLLRARLADTKVALVMHHYVSHHAAVDGDVGDAPWTMRAFVDGADRTAELDPREVLQLLPTRFNKPGGVAGMMLTAATATRVIQAMTSDDPTYLHAPGPLGLPGGYPVAVQRTGIQVCLPADITQRDAQEINERASVYDGIESIDADGTVTFAEQQMAIMRDCLGYWHRTMRLDECEAFAAELGERFKKIAQ